MTEELKTTQATLDTTPDTTTSDSAEAPKRGRKKKTADDAAPAGTTTGSETAAAAPVAHAVPSNLSFTRGIAPTSGHMHAVYFEGDVDFESIYGRKRSAKLEPVEVITTTVRGTITHDDVAAPRARVGTGSKALEAANIAAIEQVHLPPDTPYLLVESNVRFLSGTLHPDKCNHPGFAKALEEFISAYAGAGGLRELALRYMLNLANGSWLWRNRYGDDIQVRLSSKVAETVIRETDIDMRLGFTPEAIVNPAVRVPFMQLVEAAAAAFDGGPALRMKVSALLDMGEGAEVFPSQEFVSAETTRLPGSRDAEKLLAKRKLRDGRYCAAINARKMNAAIRSIDNWHGIDGVGVLVVEPFGVNTHMSLAHRVDGNDLYSYLQDPRELTKELSEGGLKPHHHFVLACLVRGGVYGFARAAGKNQAAAKAAPKDKGLPVDPDHQAITGHTAIIGQSGVGKTTFGENTLRQQAANGGGFIFIPKNKPATTEGASSPGPDASSGETAPGATTDTQDSAA